jgi:hypothetical protein
VSEEGLHREGILHGGDDLQPAATAGTGENIEIEHARISAAQVHAPVGPGAVWSSMDLVRAQVGRAAAIADDLRAPARRRGEEAVIQEQVDCGAGNDDRELLHELDGLEEQVRSAIAPHRLEFDEDASVGAEEDAVLGERGAEEVAAELLKAGTIVGGNPEVGVEVEAVELGLARAARGGVTQVRLVAEAADPCAGAGAEGDTTLDRGSGGF